MAEGDTHPDVTRVHIDREAHPHLRDTLIERFVSLSGTLTQESSAAGVAKAIGTAALTLAGRIDSADWFQDNKARWVSAYILSVRNDGAWELNSTRFKAAPAKLASGKLPLALKTWHRLALSFKGPAIQASIDGTPVANLTDTSHKKGMAGVGTDWNTAQFDNFSVR
jgi:hypothetical protein